MSAAGQTLERQFAALLAWERRKRWEQSCLMIVGVALALAIFLLPLHGYLPLIYLRWLMPIVLAFALAPYFFYRHRWQPRDCARALVQLDKTLRLAERATTAWELAGRDDRSATAELVFKQAEEHLRTVDARAVLPRQWRWQSYAALPLFLLWFALLWFDADRPMVEPSRSGVSPSLAYKLREFARALQEKAQSESLSESLKAGQALEKLAQRNIDAKSQDEQLKKELSGIAKKFAADKSSGKNDFAAGESQQSLRDLKAELDAARDLVNFPDGVKASQELAQQWMDRLASMPQIKRQLDRASKGGQSFGQNELKSFLDRLEQQATGELDRRALLDAQKFLEQMMRGQGRQDEKDKNQMQMAGRGEQESAGDGSREKNSSNLPGKEPGKKDDGFSSLPEFRGGVRTQVKGSLGEGDSSAVVLKGKPTPGKSALAEQGIVANYRRQAEQELNSERVPEALKETIRNYFLSLGEGGK